MLSLNIKKFGHSQDGINKALAAYNQGQGHVLIAIRRHGSDWAKHINSEGQRYIQNIYEIQNNNGLHIPGYFGEKR